MGASVVAVARGEEKAQVLRDSGADAVIDSNCHPTTASLVAAFKAAAPAGDAQVR